MASTDARPVPRKNTAFRLYFEIRKADGTLVTSWTGADTELSLDGGSFADATNEATEIGTSGVGYVDLTSGEMNYDCVIVKTTVTNSGALPVITYLYPEETGDIRADAVAISGDSTAADNLEAACDGTGYNVGGGSVVAASVTGNVGGSVASVTGNVGGNVAGSVGSVTAGVTLADDAITAAKFDETTAYPLAAPDAGATAVARTGADADTLQTLSDQIDAVPTLAEFVTVDTGETTAVDGSVAKIAQGAASLSAEDIWEYSPRTLTQSAAEVESVIRGIVLTITRGDSLSASVTGLGDITGRKKLWFTVKGDLADEDAASVIQIEETAGLIYLNGAAGTALDGAITVDDEDAGDITITLAAVASAELAAGSYSYDIQWVDASDGVHTLSGGPVRVTPDVTRATS